MKIDPAIFRDYDIRGIYPQQINKQTFYILGRAIASFFKVAKIAVGRDCRLSSPILFEALVAGLTDQGAEVVDLGLISTEIHYFASGFYQFPANIIISASHNPPEYNGLKIVTKGVTPVYQGFGLPQIKEIAAKKKFSPVKKKGNISHLVVLDDWLKHALKFIKLDKLRPLCLVIDAGNGMGGLSWQKLIDKLPLTIIPLFFEPDGHFPHHLPDPLRSENLIDLKEVILKQKADLGFALDGDADRLFVLDEKGNVLSGTVTTAILAFHLLSKYGPSPILYNVVCGKIVPETVKTAEGEPIRVRVGHSFIKEEMKKHQALFGGEHSGHFYFRDNFYADSSLIAGLLILEFLSQENKPLSYIAAKFAKYPASGEINFKLAVPDKIFTKIKKNFPDATSKDFLDGLSVFYPNFWFNVRASKTEPLVRLNIEAETREILQEKTKMLENLLSSFGGTKVYG